MADQPAQTPRNRISIAIASDLHIDFDQTLVQNAQYQLGQGVADSDHIRWLRHVTDRNLNEPGHPLLGPDLAAARGVDLFILAGDIGIGKNSMKYAEDVAEYIGCPVIFVAGNHDFYFSDLTALRAKYLSVAALTGGHVVFLDDSRADFIIRGIRVAVLGATLWTDYRLNGDHRINEATEGVLLGLKDHMYIGYEGRRFHPSQAMALHQRSREWLAAAVPQAVSETDCVMVVTHHGVVPEAIRPARRGTSRAPAFASDLTEDIKQWGAALVISGHTHYPLDMMVGDTKVVSAPRGYIGTEAGADQYTPMILTIPVPAG